MTSTLCLISVLGSHHKQTLHYKHVISHHNVYIETKSSWCLPSWIRLVDCGSFRAENNTHWWWKCFLKSQRSQIFIMLVNTVTITCTLDCVTWDWYSVSVVVHYEFSKVSRCREIQYRGQNVSMSLLVCERKEVLLS